MPNTPPEVPPDGQRIQLKDGNLLVPDRPILPFIEGDGIGPDIWAAAVRVFEAAVAQAYGDSRNVAWMEVLAGQQIVGSEGSAMSSLRPGSRLVREWNGRSHHVHVLDNGFAFKGRVYRSLSAIAREITGAHWSGPRFFGT